MSAQGLLWERVDSLESVERRGTLPSHELRTKYAANNRPVVFRPEAWATHLTLADLLAAYGELPVEAELSAEYGGPKRVRTTFAEAIAGVRSIPAKYRLNLGVRATFPALAAELEAHRHFVEHLAKRRIEYRLWIHPAGNYSPLHHDQAAQNLNLQLEGSKTFILFAPSEEPHLHTKERARPGRYVGSPINPFQPDLRRFPRYARATPLVAVLRPGDAIYIPKYWWHSVVAQEASVNLTAWTELGGMASWQATEGLALLRRLELLLAHSVAEARKEQRELRRKILARVRG